MILSVNWLGKYKDQVTHNPAKKKEHKLRVMLKQKSKPKQIVTSEDADSKERAKDAKYLGKKTQTFLRETSARNVGSFKKAAKGSKQGVKSASQVKEKTPQKLVKKTEAKTKKKVAQKKTKNKSKLRKKVSLADLAAPKVSPSEVMRKRPAPSLAALGLKNGKAKAAGLSANNDFVEDVPLGDMTRLNTVEYKYYGFYHRIKQKLEQYWGNSIQKKARALWKSGRRMPASENRITSLEVTIDRKGRVVRVNVKGSSGVRELDEAAIESFNKAGPFPNPPKGMVKNGHARIQWGFVVKG
tara:strand:- start:232 stop:1125 length:894 start_codon:yes stop_codon:yes gene_type:complete